MMGACSGRTTGDTEGGSGSGLLWLTAKQRGPAKVRDTRAQRDLTSRDGFDRFLSSERVTVSRKEENMQVKTIIHAFGECGECILSHRLGTKRRKFQLMNFETLQ